MARPGAKAAAKIMEQDMQRNIGYFNVSMLSLPTNFFGPDGPSDKRGLARDMRYQRLLTAIKMDHPKALPSATDHMFDVIHIGEQYRDTHNNVMMTDQVLKKVCLLAGLLENEASILVDERINASDVKAELKETTALAVSKYGAYGAPTMRVSKLNGAQQEEDQLYFGSDRFEQMAWANEWAWVGPDPSKPIHKL